jgi:hypothetical protein
MSTFSIWHWLILIIVIATYIVPVWRILTKAGYSGLWAFLSFIPLLNVILLWVFAFSRWPNEKQKA